MQLRKEGIELVKKLKPHVSGFSQEFHYSGIYGNKVDCGGAVIRVVDMRIWSDEEEAKIVYVTIDDGIGELLILVPAELWDSLSAKKDDIVIANGVLFTFEKICKFKSKAGGDIIINRGKEPFRVLVESIKKLEEGA
ncbi:DNA-binding protein [Gottfriedia acidiceleris]|uniref:DNA-binding protein n=1 Tax=Gottfriedia acidiceleris TaxID=371036 RepID=UPI003391685E